ncbi:MAG: DUF4178 domain-containing protein [Proteobacteria bacterium]|nr:DUF4178 domain-containing protein [Pseudomonadota bacterium]
MFTLSCPSCGAPVKFATQTTGYVVCDACRSMLVRRDLDVEKIGETAAVQEDGSPLQIGASGRHKKIGFEIVGRIQVAYPAGLWNEWFAIIGGDREGWIGEAMGEYFMSARIETPPDLPPFENLRRGATLTLGGVRYVVTETQRARVVACQGSLPFVQTSGYDAPVVDLKSDTAKGATIDYSEDPPLVFVGEHVEFDQLHLANLREIEGWNA